MPRHAHFLLALFLLAPAPWARGGGDDGIQLSVGKDPQGIIRLEWAGARPAFEVFRSEAAPAMTASPGHRLGTTRDRLWTDDPPSSPITFYKILPHWPQFFSSDPAHDELLNDLLSRHARADFAADSLRRPDAACPAWWTVTLWRDWEVDELHWHDFGPLNYPLDERPWFFAYLTAITPVDKFGYYFSGSAGPEPAMGNPGTQFGMGWAFPTYRDSRGLSAGWEWNGLNPEGWSAVNAANDGVQDGEWFMSTTKKDPQLISPLLDIEAFQAPFLDFEIQFDYIDIFTPEAEKVWRLYWQTEAEPFWSASKSVRSDQYPVTPVLVLAAGVPLATFHLPMYLHPRWKDQRITRLRLDPLETSTPRPARWRLNFLRLNYDTRESVNNPIFIRAAARKFFWDGDAAFLASQLTRMRQAMQFMLTHMQAGSLDLLDHSWFVGHDGLGFLGPDQPRVGHGLPNNWFDIVTTGPRDLIASVKYFQALQVMAAIEAFVEAHPESDAPKPSVLGPDGSTPVAYLETSQTLRARIEPARQAIHAEFWNPATGRYGGWRTALNLLVDYGAVQANLEALAAGIPDSEAAASILDWLDGRRIVEGDTSQGPDIYSRQFAPRANTRKNDFDWIWGWTGWTVPFSDQVEDGGASLYTSFFDLAGRLRYGAANGAWTIWTRLLEHHRTVRDFGGQGANFYRDYYAAHPELGYLQGCGIPGGLGLDCEFVENMLVPAAWPVAWLGIQSSEPGLLRIAPTLPAALSEMGARSLYFRGNRLDVRHQPGVIDLRGSTVDTAADENLELFFAGSFPPGAQVLRDGAPAPGVLRQTPTGLELLTPLSSSLYQVALP